tara:strand:- start:62 stop:343 length:282 start_codon:yes stop_codon:yes gene_type:complete
MNYFLITQDNVETIMNKVRRLTWDDANEVFSIIKDLKPVRITSDGKEDENQEELFKNKFSGTGDRNEKEKPKEALPPTASGAPLWGGDGTPVY